MLGPIFSGLSGLKNASRKMQDSANNIAKINNGGLKQSDANSDENKSKAGGFGTVRSGFLQGSNIDITEEIAGQIVSKAAFKANGNFSKANDEILGTILDIKY
jgi:flagellar hook protein FlgE